jgi:hypothetical protein
MKSRFLLLAALLALFTGCATAPSDAENDREVVLRYLNADVGTTGPFNKHAKKELDVLSAPDRAAASALLDRGAVGFVIFAPRSSAGSTDGTAAADTAPATRVILVAHGKVVGDFGAEKK